MSHQHQTTDLDRLADIAGDTAMYLLNDGQDFLQGFIEDNDLDKLPAAHAILIAAFALLKQRETHYEEQRAENFATHGSGKNGGENETQRYRDYEWLKWLIEKAMPDMTEAEFLEANDRIVRLTGA